MLAIRGPPSADGTDDSEDPSGSESKTPGPIAIETVDTPGSEAGEVRVPPTSRAIFIDFFDT